MQVLKLTLIAAALAVYQGLCHAQGHALDPGRQPDYPPGWDAIVSAWRQVEEAEYNETGSYIATVTSEIKHLGKGEPKRDTRIWNVHTKPGHKQFMVVSKYGGEKIAHVRTPDYAFTVTRGPREQAWKLVYFTKDSGSAEAKRSEENPAGAFYFCVLHPLGTLAENDRCSQFFYSDRFKKEIKDMKLVSGDNPRLEWSYNWDCQESLIMDGPPYYIARRFESRRYDIKSMPRRTTFVRELMVDGRRPDSPLPLCKSIAYKLVVEGGETLNDVQVSFSDYAFDPPSNEIFRLSYYGLPESLAEAHSARSKLWLWLLAAAAGCLLIALLTRRLARRNA